MARQREQQTTFALAVAMLLASALVHLVLLPVGNGILALSAETAPPLPAKDQIMEISLVEADPDDPDDEREPDLPGNLVNLDRVPDERPPEQTDKIAEFDSRVDKEVRAPSQRPQQGRAPTQPGDAPKTSKVSPLLHPRQAHADSGKDSGSAARSGLSDAGEGDESAAVDASPADDGQAASAPGQESSPPAPSGLVGNPPDMRDLFGRPGTFDDLHTVEEEGSESLLNARRFKYSSFFNRLRDAIAEHWHPEILHAARDPQGRIYGDKTRITRLQVSLHADGSLRAIRLEKSSDIDYLDEEAIRAVRSAAPFANPPSGLVDPETNRIDFGFAFIFEIGRAPRIHRYRR
ncbi:MAG TPA: energy transducer TonB [Nannocystis exedens]|nr:energy transducer TonB [Nannocystis exedens]